jgi:FXSXX-COOH protein
MVMKVANEQASEFASDLADLCLTPLTEIVESGAWADALARILAEQPSHHVPVAAFQSSI